jgi:hypothetical protein
VATINYTSILKKKDHIDYLLWSKNTTII